MRAHYGVGQRLLEEALAAAPEADPTLRERALTGVGILSAEQGDFDAAADAFEDALVLARTGPDQGRAATALTNLGNIAYFRGDVGPGTRLLPRRTRARARGGVASGGWRP